MDEMTREEGWQEGRMLGSGKNYTGTRNQGDLNARILPIRYTRSKENNR